MPVWVSLYLGVMLLSLPLGLVMLRRLERDWLHPVGGLLSALLSMGFTLAYWLPEAFSFESNGTLLLFAFVLFWDVYSLQRVKTRLPEYMANLGEDPHQLPGNVTWWTGLILMLPAYYFAAMVCTRVVS